MDIHILQYYWLLQKTKLDAYILIYLKNHDKYLITAFSTGDAYARERPQIFSCVLRLGFHNADAYANHGGRLNAGIPS